MTGEFVMSNEDIAFLKEKLIQIFEGQQAFRAEVNGKFRGVSNLLLDITNRLDVHDNKIDTLGRRVEYLGRKIDDAP
jgi:hypothetical protein